MLAGILVTVSIYAQSTWTIDKAHSKIGFSIVHMSISDVEGTFNDFDGNVLATSDDFAGAQVTFTAKSNSIDTDNERRDGHLKSPDFFDAEKYPDVSFKGNIIKEGAAYKLKGDFTMHGVTKQVAFDVKYNGKIETGRGTKAGFSVKGQINRKDYGLTWDNKVPTGELIVSDVVDLNLKVELDKQQPVAADK